MKFISFSSFFICYYSKRLNSTHKSIELNSIKFGERRGGGGSFPWKEVWKVKTPRVRFFIWSAVKGNILTTDNLRRRGFITPGVLCAKQLGRTLLIIFFFFALYCCQ